MKPLFTPEELAELAAFDAEVDASDITFEEAAEVDSIDRDIKRSNLSDKARKLAEYQRRYREANKDEIAEYQRRYREANKEKINERRRQKRNAAKGAAVHDG